MRSSATPQVATSHGCSAIIFLQCSTLTCPLTVVVTVVSFFSGFSLYCLHLRSVFISSFQSLSFYFILINNYFFINVAGACSHLLYGVTNCAWMFFCYCLVN